MRMITADHAMSGDRRQSSAFTGAEYAALTCAELGKLIRVDHGGS
jgi:hypothetical protein